MANFEKCHTYPLLDAALEGRALRALTNARTDEDARQFTLSWGLLHYRLEGDRWDRFPLDLFQLYRAYFLALAHLSVAVRSQETEQISLALKAFKAAKATLQAHPSKLAVRDPRVEAAREAFFGDQPHDDGSALRDPFRVLFTEKENLLAEQGIPAIELLVARHEPRTVSLQEYAARVLASELEMSRRVRPRLETRQGPLDEGDVPQPFTLVTLVETPLAFTLVQVLRWDVRARYRVLHHYLCEGCGNAAISWRADTRFCGVACGTRVRVRAHRVREGRLRRKRARAADASPAIDISRRSLR